MNKRIYYLRDVINPDEEVRESATKKLRNFMEVTSSYSSREEVMKIREDISSELVILTNSSDYYKNLGALCAIKALMDFCDHSTIIPYANYVKNIILNGNSGSDHHSINEFACDVLGDLLQKFSENLIDFTNEYATSSIRDLKEATTKKRQYNSLWLLKTFIQNCPSLFYNQLPSFLNNITKPLTDNNSDIRITAGKTLSCVEKLLVERPITLEIESYFQSIYDLGISFSSFASSLEMTHSSLLIWKAQIENKIPLVYNHYDVMCGNILKYACHANPLVRETIVELIPYLAELNPDLFLAYYESSINLIMFSLKYSINPTLIYISFGKLLLILPNKLQQPMTIEKKPNTNVIIKFLQHIKSAIKERKSYFKGALQSLELFSKSPVFAQYIHIFIPLFIELPLSTELISTLCVISNNIQSVKKTIEKLLIERLSKVLVPMDLNNNHSRIGFLSNSNNQYDISICLHTLKTFPFVELDNILYMQKIQQYLIYNDWKIRKSAALAIIKLYLIDENSDNPGQYLKTIMFNIIKYLIPLACTDPEGDIKYVLLKELNNPKFYSYLVQKEYIVPLFQTIQDDDLTVRLLGLHIIEKLLPINPLHMMIHIRRLLHQLSSEIQCNVQGLEKETTITLLGEIIKSCSDYVHPYCQPIYYIMTKQLEISERGPTITVILNVLENILKIGYVDISDTFESLFSKAIDCLRKQISNETSAAALRVIIQITIKENFVIKPYYDYEDFYPLLLTIAKSSKYDLKLRTLAVTVLGKLGLLDPYKYSLLVDKQTTESIEIDYLSAISPLKKEAIYTEVIIKSLLKLLKDNSVCSHHHEVLQSFRLIFTTIPKKKYDSYWNIIFPSLIEFGNTCLESTRPQLFQLFRILFETEPIVSRVYLPSLYELFFKYWNNSLKECCECIVDTYRVLHCDISIHANRIIQLIQETLESDTSPNRITSIELLNLIHPLVKTLYSINCVVLLSPLKYIEMNINSLKPPYLIAHLGVVNELCEYEGVERHAIYIVENLITIIEKTSSNEVIKQVMECFIKLVYNLKDRFYLFIDSIDRILKRRNIIYKPYSDLAEKVKLREIIVKPELNKTLKSDTVTKKETRKQNQLLNYQKLYDAWICTNKSTPSDFTHWLKNVHMTFLSESPQPLFRVCKISYYPFARDMFFLTFDACWDLLDIPQKQQFREQVKYLFSCPAVPNHVLINILSLLEYFNRTDRQLLIEQQTIVDKAIQAKSNEKAVKCAESLFLENHNNVDSLIYLYNQLNYTDSAVGILTILRKSKTEIPENGKWYEKLGKWDEALAIYEENQLKSVLDLSDTFGRIRCLGNKGEYARIIELATPLRNKVNNLDDKLKDEWVDTLPYIVESYLSTNNLSEVDYYASQLSDTNIHDLYIKARIALFNNDLDNSLQYIQLTREKLSNNLTLSFENYSRLYKSLEVLIIVSELEEVIKFKRFVQYQEYGNNSGNNLNNSNGGGGGGSIDMEMINPAIEEKKELLKAVWRERFEHLQPNTDLYFTILNIRKDIISSDENLDEWLKLVSCSMREKKDAITESVLQFLGIGRIDNEVLHPKILYTYYKYQYSKGECEDAIKNLKELIESTDEVEFPKTKISAIHRYVKWHFSKITVDNIEELLTISQSAITLDPSIRKAWHRLALLYYKCLDTDILSELMFDKHMTISSAIQCFCTALNLSGKNKDAITFQDLLRLISLWFKYGNKKKVQESLAENMKKVALELWLNVIPQLIARMYVKQSKISKFLNVLLENIGEKYPQAIIYPMYVSNSLNKDKDDTDRQYIIDNVLETIKTHHLQLYQESSLVSKELIRIAVVWGDMLICDFDKALGFARVGNFDNMINTFDMFFDATSTKPPETATERLFLKKYGDNLEEIKKLLNNYKLNRSNENYEVLRTKAISLLRTIRESERYSEFSLQQVSPNLAEAHDLELLIPVTYCEIKEKIKIKRFFPTITVINSKQKPRKFLIEGDDGKSYVFLLKGNDDLRQDERVMQALGLVNEIIDNTRDAMHQGLLIQRYSCTPLSASVGIVEWIHNTDTLNTLLSDYRNAHGNGIYVETTLFKDTCPHYESAPIIQLLEAFEYSQSRTNGMELANILWLKSESSEIWVEKRSLYVKSLAVMSMVGYLMGMGDRHLSNIMLDRRSGRICHIDFGDCFETASHRERFPEKVPFRLTRMLVNAMEVKSVEGSYRLTCERVMKVLRDSQNVESLMALLEAFVYDPLINWRLVQEPRYRNESGNNDDNDNDLMNNHNKGSDRESSLSKDSFAFHEFFNNPSDTSTGSTYSYNSIGSRNRRMSVSAAVYDVADEKHHSLKEMDHQAIKVLSRIHSKLTGTDFPNKTLDVQQQVDRLIEEATSPVNLCQSYIGWCPFW